MPAFRLLHFPHRSGGPLLLFCTVFIAAGCAQSGTCTVPGIADPNGVSASGALHRPESSFKRNGRTYPDLSNPLQFPRRPRRLDTGGGPVRPQGHALRHDAHRRDERPRDGLFDRHSGSESVLYSFKGTPDGSSPYAGLIDVNGTLYGTTYHGGAARRRSGLQDHEIRDAQHRLQLHEHSGRRRARCRID